jgi:hypothetical protein
MAKAKCNKPMGARYNKLFGEWLRDNGLDDINDQDRYRAIMCADHREAIEAWRATLDPVKRRKYNHPNCVWHTFRRATAPSRENRAIVRHIREREGKPVYWSQAALRRAHEAVLKSRSSDLMVLARVALQGAIRTEADLLALLETPPTHAPIKPMQAVTLAS